MKKQILAMLCVEIMTAAMLLWPITAFGTEDPTPAANTLTLECLTETKASIANESFAAYYIAEPSGYGRFTSVWPFGKVRNIWEDMTAASWAAAAAELDEFARANHLTPFATATTDADGHAVLLTDAPAGLYLVTGSPAENEGFVYTPTAFLVCLPTRTTDGADDSSPTASVKYEKQTIPTPPPSPTPTPTPSPTPTPDSPRTGDFATPIAYLATLLTSCFGLAGIGFGIKQGARKEDN